MKTTYNLFGYIKTLLYIENILSFASIYKFLIFLLSEFFLSLFGKRDTKIKRQYMLVFTTVSINQYSLFSLAFVTQ